MAHRTDANPVDEPTIGKLIADTTQDFSHLIRSEIELAKSELRVSVKAGGTGIALFAASVTDADTGYALTADQVEKAAQSGAKDEAEADTGDCAL